MIHVGYQIRPRDARGWRIPRPGSVARKIYDGMIQGHSYRQIAADTRRDKDHYVAYVMNRIRNPDRDNARRSRRRVNKWLDEAKKYHSTRKDSTDEIGSMAEPI